MATARAEYWQRTGPQSFPFRRHLPRHQVISTRLIPILIISTDYIRNKMNDLKAISLDIHFVCYFDYLPPSRLPFEILERRTTSSTPVRYSTGILFRGRFVPAIFIAVTSVPVSSNHPTSPAFIPGTITINRLVTNDNNTDNDKQSQHHFSSVLTQPNP